MSLILNGDGSIQSLVAGGLPDATVQTADIVDGAVTAAKMSGAQTGAAPVYGCRAWCVFNGTTAGTNAPIAGGNVTSVTRNAAGDYTVNFTTPMQDALFAFSGTAYNATNNAMTFGCYNTAAQTASSVRFFVFQSSTATLTDPTVCTVMVVR